MREAGAVLAGGHTVEGEEPLFGFAVTGTVDADAVASNAGAQVGDQVYLTKPLGMGSMTTAAKFQKISWETMLPAAQQMATLNAAAAEAMMSVGAHACTDITGFGLIGHSHNIASASGVTLRFDASSVPFFDGALELAGDGVLSGGTKRGKAAVGDDVSFTPTVPSAAVDIMFDAETSGGLLIVVDPARAPQLQQELAARKVPVHRVGEVLARTQHVIEVV